MNNIKYSAPQTWGQKISPLYNKKVLIADTEKEVLRLSDSRSFPPWSSKDRAKA